MFAFEHAEGFFSSLLV